MKIEKEAAVVDLCHKFMKLKPEYESLYLAAKQAREFSDILNPFRNLADLIGKCFIVCGPVTSGGTGDVVKNLYNLANAGLYYSEHHSIKIFPQFIFEEPIAHTWEKLSSQGLTPIEVNKRLFEELYFPFFEHENLEGPIFTHDWKSSNGAIVEHEYFTYRHERYSIAFASSKVQDYKILLP